MANRTAAKHYEKKFRLMAANPTPANRKRAQELYEKLFVNECTSIGVCREDFHVGEMYCNDALRELGIHRHPDDHYLQRRGIADVMDV